MKQPAIRVAVDPSNPGQFFACCGLFELADRLWRGAEAWFEERHFCIVASINNANGNSLAELLAAVHAAKLFVTDADNEMTSPLRVPSPFNLQLDWWNDDRSGGGELKTWAGRMKVVGIANAMHATLIDSRITPESLLNLSAVLFDPEEAKKTIEPFYFDARRAAQAHVVDIGFSPDAQQMKMPVFAAVEFLCLVGLQRFRPSASGDDRTRRYSTWSHPLSLTAAAAIACGAIAVSGVRQFRFRLLFRTKYLKGFLTALPE